MPEATKSTHLLKISLFTKVNLRPKKILIEFKGTVLNGYYDDSHKFT